MTSNSFFAIGLALVGTALTFAVSAGPAVASPMEPRSVSIVVNPSDLATVSSRAALDARIKRAARHVCGVDASERNLGLRQSQSNCVADTVQRTQQQVAELKMSTIRLAAR